MNRILLALLALIAIPAVAQYSQAAGENAPTVREVERRLDRTTGKMEDHVVLKQAPKDGHGNAQGNQFDLAVDGAFEGQTVAVIQLYPFGLESVRVALKEKGFSLYRWNGVPKVEELEAGLAKASQLWIISGAGQQLTDAHLKAIKKFFDAGHGVYVWGDNDPYYADANAVGEALVGVTMKGNLMGDKTVGLQQESGKAGVLRRHLLSTGLEYIYEGITIATIQDPHRVLSPLIHGSENNLVAGFYDQGGKRLIFDGGFTRLYNKWDTAGTGRYVKNAAAWLANAERFGAKAAVGGSK